MGENIHKILLSLLVIFLALSVLIWPERWKSLFNSDSKESIELEYQNGQIKSINEKLQKERLVQSERIKRDSILIEDLNKKIEEIDGQISIVDISISSKKNDLEKIRKENIESKRIIDIIRSTPNTKSGDTLLLSIKNRIK